MMSPTLRKEVADEMVELGVAGGELSVLRRPAIGQDQSVSQSVSQPVSRSVDSRTRHRVPLGRAYAIDSLITLFLTGSSGRIKLINCMTCALVGALGLVLLVLNTSSSSRHRSHPLPLCPAFSSAWAPENRIAMAAS